MQQCELQAGDVLPSARATNFYVAKKQKRLLLSELTAYRLAQLVQHRTTVGESAGSNPGQTNTQGRKIIEEKVLPL